MCLPYQIDLDSGRVSVSWKTWPFKPFEGWSIAWPFFIIIIISTDRQCSPHRHDMLCVVDWQTTSIIPAVLGDALVQWVFQAEPLSKILESEMSVTPNVTAENNKHLIAVWKPSWTDCNNSFSNEDFWLSIERALLGFLYGVMHCRTLIRRLPGRRVLVVVFIKNMLFEIIAFVVFECL